MVELRRATAGDELAVATVHVRSWQAAYDGLLPAAGLAALRPEDRAKIYAFEAIPTVVAEDDGVVLGFVTYADRDGAAEVWALYVDPGHWHGGLGARLLDHAMADLAAQGWRTVDLWVLRGNTRAEQFYLRQGLKPTGRTRRELLLGVEIEEFGLRADLTRR